MIEITNMKQAFTELQKIELSQNTIKDILLQAYIIDTQYPKEIQNYKIYWMAMLWQKHLQKNNKNFIESLLRDTTNSLQKKWMKQCFMGLDLLFQS